MSNYRYSLLDFDLDLNLDLHISSCLLRSILSKFPSLLPPKTLQLQDTLITQNGSQSSYRLRKSPNYPAIPTLRALHRRRTSPSPLLPSMVLGCLQLRAVHGMRETTILASYE